MVFYFQPIEMKGLFYTTVDETKQSLYRKVDKKGEISCHQV